MTLKPWQQLPAMVRRSRGKLYEYIRTEMGTGENTDLNARLEHIEGLLSVDVSFTVKDDEETPIQGATVTLNSKSGTTGKSGGCTIRTVLPNTYILTVSKNGFKDHSEEITVDNTHKSFNVILTGS